MPKHGQTPYNKDNKIVIKLQDATTYKALKEKQPKEITELVNEYIKKMDTGRKPIRVARRLNSGNISIITANEEEAKALREHKE